MDKHALSERDICTKFITPALRKAGWDEIRQIREEVSFTKGRIIVRGKLVSRGKGKRADYILSVNPPQPTPDRLETAISLLTECRRLREA
jgi:type I restriction enzyme, R subunit